MSDPILPPLSHAEGGEPQSKVAPGDPTRELIHEVRNMAQSIMLLRVAVERINETRPSRGDVAFRRYRSVLTILIILGCAIVATDEHVERCGPGARTEAAVDTLIERGDYEAIRNAAANSRTPRTCDVTFPFHSHDDISRYPSGDNLLGLAGYAMLLALGGAVYVRKRHDADSE